MTTIMEESNEDNDEDEDEDASNNIHIYYRQL